jgi:hypothetical protein
MTRRIMQAHREPPQTAADWLDYIAAHRAEVARDFAALVLIFAALAAVYIMLWGMGQ